MRIKLRVKNEIAILLRSPPESAAAAAEHREKLDAKLHQFQVLDALCPEEAVQRYGYDPDDPKRMNLLGLFEADPMKYLAIDCDEDSQNS